MNKKVLQWLKDVKNGKQNIPIEISWQIDKETLYKSYKGSTMKKGSLTVMPSGNAVILLRQFIPRFNILKNIAWGEPNDNQEGAQSRIDIKDVNFKNNANLLVSLERSFVLESIRNENIKFIEECLKNPLYVKFGHLITKDDIRSVMNLFKKSKMINDKKFILMVNNLDLQHLNFVFGEKKFYPHRSILEHQQFIGKKLKTIVIVDSKVPQKTAILFPLSCVTISSSQKLFFKMARNSDSILVTGMNKTIVRVNTLKILTFGWQY